MDKSVLDILSTYGPFAALCFWLLYTMRQDHQQDKREAKDREEKLMEHIQKSDDTHAVIANKVEEVSRNMNDMQKNMATMQTTMMCLQKDIDDLKKD